MSNAFQENFIVVWDTWWSRWFRTGKCPFRDITTCVEEVPLSRKKRYTPICCGHEKALMWAIQNKNSFDNVWFMEEDVMYTDIAYLKDVVSAQSSDDLLYHEDIHIVKEDKQWYWAPFVRKQANTNLNLFQETQMRHSLYNMFRMSTRFLEAMDTVYKENDNEWIFFEAMVPTVAAHYNNLTSFRWTEDDSLSLSSSEASYNLRYRPCYTSFPSPGIYHPVKFRNGRYEECAHPKW